jgi:hypothetical protein
MRIAPFILMLVTAGASGISSTKADTVGPARYSIQFDGVPGAVDASEASPQSGSYAFFGGTLDVNAAAAATAQPATSANVMSGGCTSGFPGSGCAGGIYSVLARVDYYIEASGPAGAMVPLFFDTAGGITLSGEYGVGIVEGVAEVSLIPPGGPGLTGFFVSTANVNGNRILCVNRLC